MIAPEFSHLIAVTRKQSHHISADAAACERIAARLGLIALDSLTIRAEALPINGGVAVTGCVAASLVQRCAATDMPVPATIDAPFDLRFLRDVPDAADTPVDVAMDEIELGADDCDVLPLEGDQVDLGEAAVQTLSLALDPFPRHPDADRLLAEKGILTEGQAGPFAALAALRKS